MGAGCDPVVEGQLHSAAHHRRITGVKTAGDIGRADQRDDFFIQADAIVAKALTDIGIEINYFLGLRHVTSLKKMLWDGPSSASMKGAFFYPLRILIVNAIPSGHRATTALIRLGLMPGRPPIKKRANSRFLSADRCARGPYLLSYQDPAAVL